MKFIHIADIHLGARPDAGSTYSEKRGSEIWDTFRRAVELCGSERADLLLIAGDLFHRQPLMRELKEVDYLFSCIPGTQVVLVAGNHDYIKKDSYYRTFPWSRNVHMILSEGLSCVEFEDLHTAVYGCSYYERERPEPLYEQAQVQDGCKYHILLAHGGDAQHLPFRKAEVEKKGFDYVALGHIHKPQVLIPGRMAYAGALEPIDKNDEGAHGLIMGVVGEAGCRIEFVPFAGREYHSVKIEVGKDTTGYGLRALISGKLKEMGTQNLYKVRLEGFKSPDVRFDPGQLDVYGNIVEIRDHTEPAYDFARLLAANQGNLLGRFIESFKEAKPGSVEYEALCEGVGALLKQR